MLKHLIFCSIFLLYQAFLIRAVANSGDSVLAKYRSGNNYRDGSFIWNANHFFYLVKKSYGSTGIKTLIPAVRKLNDKWEIIKFDTALKFDELNKLYSTIIPANNNWKYTEAMQSKLASKSWPATILLRIGFLNKLPAGKSLNPFLTSIIYKNYPDYNCAEVWVSGIETLVELASDTAITSISIAPAQAHTEQAIKRLDHGTNYISKVHDAMPLITGAGTTVCIKENLFDTTDIDFKNRYFLTSYSPDEIDNHAGIIATMVGGSGNSYYTGKGAAWQTTITSANFSNLMPEPLDYYEQNKIDVQNHSYGTGIENEYAADAAAYDLTSWTDTTLLHIFSAGNSGTSSPSSGKYTGIVNKANLTGSFKMSKNSLAIGGTDSFYHTEILSSKGPAYDGRIKPELVAFGIDGTSGAAALTSGTALLLQQKLKQQSGQKPSAALVKALLINGADDIDAEGPDFSGGYGSLNAYRSLQIADKNNYFTASINNGQAHENIITVPANTAWLKVTLAWTDTPAAPLSFSAIMNDLDLQLQNSTDGTIIKPWILSTAANADSLRIPAIRGIDSLNTVEVISLLKPLPGDYIIRINTRRLYTNKQPFAVAWDMETEDTINITYPTQTAACFGNDVQTIRWQSSYLGNETGKLQYKYTGSNEWKVISDALPLKQGWYQWQTPDTTAKALLRITTGINTFNSDTFIISKPLTIQIGYYCADSMYLYWNKQPVTNYRLYNLGDTLLEPLATVTDTFYKTPVIGFKNTYVAVAPVIETREAIRSYAIDFTKQGVACYISNFLADLFADSVTVTLTLGTNFNLNKIILEKQVNGVFTDIDSLSPQQALTYFFTDNQLNQGGNIYRIKLVLNTGTVLYSQAETVYYLRNKVYLVYPNPVKQGQSVFIVNRFFDGDLYTNLYDITGRLLNKLNLPLALNTVITNNLSTGIYILVFNDGSKKLGIEKLVIQ